MSRIHGERQESAARGTGETGALSDEGGSRCPSCGREAVRRAVRPGGRGVMAREERDAKDRQMARMSALNAALSILQYGASSEEGVRKATALAEKLQEWILG